MSQFRVFLAAGVIAGLAVGGRGRLRADEPEKTALLSYRTNQSFTVNAYIGMVNGEPFFVENILRPIDDKLQRLATTSRTIGEFRGAAHDLIEREVGSQISNSLVIKAAKDFLTEADNHQVDFYMNRESKSLLTEHAGSAAKADQELRAQGTSMEKVLAEKRRNYIVEFYLHKTLYPKIVVTRKQMEDEYNRNLKNYIVPAEVDLYTVTIPISRFLTEPGPDGTPVRITRPTAAQIQTATTMAVSRAGELITQLQSGAEFALIAQNNSSDIKATEGGRWPHTRKGMLAKQQIEDAAFSLPPHGIAAPVVITDTSDPARSVVVIVKIEDITPGRTIPFSEAQDELYGKMRERQYFALTNEYYAKLRAKAAIEGVDRMVDTVTDAAVTRYLVK